MKRIIEYLQDVDIIHVRTFGVYSLGKEIDTLKRVADELKAHNCKKALFDHTQAFLFVPPKNAYQRPEVYNQIGLDKDMKIATLYNEVIGVLDTYLQIAIQQGWNVAAFKKEEDALAWLSD